MKNPTEEPEARSHGQEVKKADLATLAQQNNAFALDLYAKLSTSEGNLFLSPISISTALAMVYSGARRRTAEQMASVLHWALESERLHSANADFLQSLHSSPERKHYQLQTVNSMWGQKGYRFVPAFRELLTGKYGPKLLEADFQTNSEQARQAINRWVEDQTQDKITDLIPLGALNSMTRVVLANAIYFYGKWVSCFDSNETEPDRFTLKVGLFDSQKVEISMMHQTGTFRYMEDSSIQALELPYTGNDLGMTIFLPRRPDGLTDFQKLLTLETLSACLSRLTAQRVSVYLPKFRTSVSILLAGTLGSMGMSDAFSPEKANFSGISEEKGFCVSEIIHKAFVAVDEEGTEAAAATATLITGAAFNATPKPLPVFRADHPFAFLIRDLHFGSILFFGRVVDPR